MRCMLIGVVLLCCTPVGFAKSFGTVGATFVIAEMSFLDFIHLRLKALSEGDSLAKLAEKWQEKADFSANRPTSIGLPRATQHRTYHYDPTMQLVSDILDEYGRVLYAKGTRVNGLEVRPDYAPCWLLLNFDDAAQARWVQKERVGCPNPKIILTGGAIQDAEKALAAVIYFDQGGALVSRFQLRGLPASVTRNGNQLEINEFLIKESGDAI